MDHKIVARQLQELNSARIEGAKSLMPDHQGRSFFSFVDKNPFFSDNSVNAIYEYLFSTCKSRSAYKITFESGINDFTNHFISLN